MAKYNVNLSGTFDAGTAEEAKEALFAFYKALNEGIDVENLLKEGECFDFSTTFSAYGE
jgi:hypothetical protein